MVNILFVNTIKLCLSSVVNIRYSACSFSVLIAGLRALSLPLSVNKFIKLA